MSSIPRATHGRDLPHNRLSGRPALPRLTEVAFLAAIGFCVDAVAHIAPASVYAAEPDEAATPDLAACETWKAAAVADLERQLDSTTTAHKQAQKDRNKEQMKSLLEQKRQLADSLRELRAKSLEECWPTVQEARAKREAAEAEAARQRAVWEAAEKGEQARKEAAAKKAAVDREFLKRQRAEIKRGRNILTRGEFKEKVRGGMSPSQVLEAVGVPDKTQESGDSKSFIYYKKTIDDMTGKDDTLVMVNFWKREVRSVTFP